MSSELVASTTSGGPTIEHQQLYDIMSALREDVTQLKQDGWGDDDVRVLELNNIHGLLKDREFSEALTELTKFVYDGPASWNAPEALKLLEKFINA